MPFKTTIARSAEQMAELGPMWRACAAADPCATIFQSYEWNLAAARYFAEREQPYVIAVEGDGGAAIIPAAISGDSCTLLGEKVSDYGAVLASNTQCLAVAWERLAELRLPLRFTALRPERHAIFDQLSTQPFVGAPYLSGKSAEEFAAEHNRMFSRLRKLQRLCFELRERRSVDAELLCWLYAKKADADPESLFHDGARVAMLLETFAALGSVVEVCTLEREGTIIAAAVAFRDRETMRFYTNWYDAAWSHYSPGMVLLYEMTRRALARGLSCDYMTGEQPYKLRMANHAARLVRVSASAAEIARAGTWLATSYNGVVRERCQT